jgi:dolichol-phosphate mannosyltransferase
MLFSVVVPVYNEEETLRYTHERLTKVLQGIQSEFNLKVEIIYVNDGSADRSADLINTFSKENSSDFSVLPVQFSRNFGHSSAVLAGLHAAQGDYIGIIDADLQDPPELFKEMLREIQSGMDVVYGQRSNRQSESAFKKFTAWLFYRILNLMTGVEIPRDTGDFRVITKEVKEAVISCNEPDPFLRGLVAWVGFHQKAIQYVRESRKFGTTKYPFSKMVKFATKAILAFSTFPLRFVIFLGLSTLVLSFILVFWVLFVYFTGRTVQGWTSLLAIFLFFQAITILMIGIIGLYVGQMHISVQNRPRYIIRKK